MESYFWLLASGVGKGKGKGLKPWLLCASVEYYYIILQILLPALLMIISYLESRLINIKDNINRNSMAAVGYHPIAAVGF